MWVPILSGKDAASYWRKACDLKPRRARNKDYTHNAVARLPIIVHGIFGFAGRSS